MYSVEEGRKKGQKGVKSEANSARKGSIRGKKGEGEKGERWADI